MGSSEADEDYPASPPHEVRLSPFLLAKHEVTQWMWNAIMYMDRSEPAFRGDDLPIETVSWDECIVFCARTGLRLPTEAQWEFACQAGERGAPWSGREITTDDANISAGGWESNATMSVGSFPPDGLGLFDMCGNVTEWCLDAYDPHFYASPAASGLDPWCPTPTPAGEYVYRGGAFRSSPSDCDCRRRASMMAHQAFDAVGFRPAFYPLPDLTRE